MRLRISLLCLIFVFFNSACAAESESVEKGVTINSPAELIAEDFLRVAVVPSTWEFRYKEWIGDEKIDVRKITKNDIEINVEDEKKRKALIEIINHFSQFETYRKGNMLTKRVGSTVISEIKNERVSKLTKEILEEFNAVAKPNISLTLYDESMEGRTWSNAIKIKTYGHTADNDMDFSRWGEQIQSSYYFSFYGGPIVLSKYGDHYIHNYFKGLLSSSLFDENILEWENTIGFTDYVFKKKTNDIHFYTEGYNSNNDIQEITYSECHVYSEHKEAILRSLITECLLRSMGLTGLSYNHNSSLGVRSEILEDVQWKIRITDYDLLFLNILYSKEVKPSMTVEELMPIVKKQIHYFKNINNEVGD